MRPAIVMVEAPGIEPGSAKRRLVRLRVYLATGQPVVLMSRSLFARSPLGTTGWAGLVDFMTPTSQSSTLASDADGC